MEDFEEEDMSPIKKLAAQVEKIIKIESVLSSDPNIWEIHFAGSAKKVMKIDTDHLDKSTTFEKMYLKLFGSPAPITKQADFKRFLRIITNDKNKVEIVMARSESEHEYIAKQVFETVCSIPLITTDKQAAETGKGLLDYEDDGCLCLVSGKVEEIVQSKGYKIGLSDLSAAMTELGYKTDGTAAIRYKNKRLRSWHFFKTVVEEMREVPNSENNSELEAGEAA
jgi:hypothetical protein